MENDKKYTEVIWYGRGGQGAITASQLIAEAASIEGYKGITTAPSFGAERRGAPVAAFLRLSQEPIRIFSRISSPDIIVILDPTLMGAINMADFNPESMVVINSTQTCDELNLGGFSKVGIADITSVALDNDLTAAGVAILNTPILGAFVHVTGLVSLASLEKAIKKKFPGDKADLNMKTAKIIYESTEVYTRNGKG